MTKKLHIKTWGCQMNEYDSSKMADLLDATHGYQLTDVAEEADVLLLNTCSIREKAQEKVFHQLGRWKLLKEKNPDLIIGVGGCVASQEGEHIRQRAHYVDIIFGPQTLHRLPEMLGIPVIPVSARQRRGLDILLHAAAHHKDCTDPDCLIHHHKVRSKHRHDHHSEYTMVYSDEIEDKIDQIIKNL